MRLAPELKSKIDTLWDKFWSSGLSNPLSSIEQMSYLIFMKRLDDMVQEDDEGKYYGLYGDKISDKNAWTLLWGSFYGYDFEPTMVRISLMNMVLHGIATPNIEMTVQRDRV